MESRLCLGEPTSVDLAARGQEDEEVLQLVVGVRYGRADFDRSVDELEQHVVVAGDDDVLDPIVVHQRLEASEAEE